jgi:hypothetical protein
MNLQRAKSSRATTKSMEDFIFGIPAFFLPGSLLTPMSVLRQRVCLKRCSILRGALYTLC